MKQTASFLVENKISESQMEKHFGHLSKETQSALVCEYPLVRDSHGSRSQQTTFEVWDGDVPTGKQLRCLKNGEWRVEASPIYG